MKVQARKYRQESTGKKVQVDGAGMKVQVRRFMHEGAGMKVQARKY